MPAPWCFNQLQLEAFALYRHFIDFIAHVSLYRFVYRRLSAVSIRVIRYISNLSGVGPAYYIEVYIQRLFNSGIVQISIDANKKYRLLYSPKARTPYNFLCRDQGCSSQVFHEGYAIECGSWPDGNPIGHACMLAMHT